MSKISKKSTHVPTHIIVDAAELTSNCNTISFENYGNTAAKIYTNANPDYNYLTPGMTKIFGGLPDVLVQDTFDIVFDVGAASKGINIMKEYINIIE